MKSSTDHAEGHGLSGITRYQWLVFFIASAGWIFDVYEGQLFAVFKDHALTELLGGSPGAEVDSDLIDMHGNIAFALFLIGGAAGGLGFGILGDRIGRVRTMGLTILVYSIFSALTFFATSIWQLHTLRLLVALGVGGEWAIAASLVAETFPARARALAGGMFHASSVLGLVLAALTGILLARPDLWRWGFLVGLLPALLVLWIRMSLREPERWRRTAGQTADAGDPAPDRPKRGPGSLVELLGDRRWRFRAMIGLGLAAIGLGTYWGVFVCAIDLIKDVLGDEVSEQQKQATASQVYMFITVTGSLLGLLAFAPIASRFGRRGAFLIYHLGALVVAPATFLLASSFYVAVAMLALMAVFVVGMHAGYAIYFPELFPTRLRATGTSFCFNVGRVLGAAMLFLRGALGAEFGLRTAVAIMSLFFLVGIGLLAVAPETRGTELPE